MNILKDILLELNLLKEDASVVDITDAIKNMYKVKVSYEGNGHTKERIVCPVAYGISTAGNPVIRAFQEAGDTNTSVPKWKLFRLDRINTWETLSNEKFDANDLVGFNKDGDEQIENLYSIAPIGKAKSVSITTNSDGEVSAPITDKPITKLQIQEPTKSAKAINMVNNSSFTADDAINNVLSTAKNVQTNIDNEKQDTYNSNDTINAQDSTPIYQGDITGDNNDSTDLAGQKDNNEPPLSDIDNTPVTKSELDKEPESDEDMNTVINEFRDLLGRMNKIIF